MGSRPSKQIATVVSIERSKRNFNNHSLFKRFLPINNALSNTAKVSTKRLITIVWLDSYSVSQDHIIDTRVTKRTLSHAVLNGTLVCYNDQNSFIEFLRQQTDSIDIIFLVVSGRDSLVLFNSLDKTLLERIDSIFIFCLSKTPYEMQVLCEKKVIGIYQEHSELVQSIQQQVTRINQQDLIVKFYAHNQKAARFVPSYTKGEFVWIRALKEAMLNIEKTDNIKKNMYDRFRIIHRHDTFYLKDIDKFEKEYQAEKAIEWYTKDSFLYRTLNQSLRTENVDELLTFSPYISDLSLAMRAWHAKVDKTMKFFRGCILTMEAVNEFRNNIKSLLAINTFFSASRRRDVAEIYAGYGMELSSTTDVSVIFEIEVHQSNRFFFADISKFSHFKDEAEVIFDLNTIFIVDNVTFNDVDKCWIIDLITDEETYVKYEQIYEDMCELCSIDKSPLLTVGMSLLVLGNTRSAFQYATNLLSLYPRTPGCYLLFAIACTAECNYAIALERLSAWYTSCEKSGSFEIHRRWTDAAVWITEILLLLGENQMASQYIKSIIKYYEDIRWSVHHFQFRLPDYLSFFKQLERNLQSNNRVKINGTFLSHCDLEEMAPIVRGLLLPGVYTRYAESLIEENLLVEALDNLKKAEIEADLLLPENSLVRIRINIAHACLCIYAENYELCCLYLNQVEKVARMNLSRSSSCSLGCVYILREMVSIIGRTEEEETCFPLARTAFIQAENYIDVPKVMFILSNICTIHRIYRNKLSPTGLVKLDQFLIDTFQICRFELIMQGKSSENVYRPLLTYMQQVVAAQIQHEERL